MFLGLLFTCVVVIAAVAGKNLLHKGDDLLWAKDSGTTLTANPETSGAYIKVRVETVHILKTDMLLMREPIPICRI